MDIQQEVRDGVTVVAPSGRIDSTTSAELEQAIGKSLDGGNRKLVVDFERVSYISSAGLRVLLVAAKRLGGGKGTLALCSLNDAVRQVFDLAGFLPLFTVEPTRDGAVARCAGA
jgi:anti-anti-sigma factor